MVINRLNHQRGSEKMTKKLLIEIRDKGTIYLLSLMFLFPSKNRKNGDYTRFYTGETDTQNSLLALF